MDIEDWDRSVTEMIRESELIAIASLFLSDSSKRNLRRNFDKDEPIRSRSKFLQEIFRKCNYFVISTDESFLFYWLIVLNVCVLYNLWFSIARQAFDPLERDYATLWHIMDYVADTIYFLDIGIQFRTGYLEQGKSNSAKRKIKERRVPIRN